MLKIAVVVHGRFHAFDLARALLARGHDLTVFTNYPRWAAERFGLPRERVRGFWLHGGLSRAAWQLYQRGGLGYPEAVLHPLFGCWARSQLLRETWDVVHSWSGVSEEIHRALLGWPTLRLLLRGSAHVRAQARLLEEEERRTGARQDRPTPWIIAREEREYALADQIVVLSTFSYRTFLEEGVPSDRVGLLLSGANLAAFRPPAAVLEQRVERIRSGAPLRVLNVGVFSFRKGMWDFATAVRDLALDRFQFRFVGSVAGEARALAGQLRPSATFIPNQPQGELPGFYNWGDVFVLPSIEDGFQTVLGQAAAAGLPIITTPNGAGLDLVREGQNGWIVPIRDPRALVERLRWCDTHRSELAAMVARIAADDRPRDWNDVAADFETLCRTRIRGRSAGPAMVQSENTPSTTTRE